MITSIFKKYMSCILESSSSTKGVIPAMSTAGQPIFLSNRFNVSSCFPYSVTTNLATSASYAGIAIGNGTTPATVDDYRIESCLASGTISLNVGTAFSLTQDGDPQVSYTLTITNVSSSSINISELAYNQQVYASTVADSTSLNTQTVCFDRTVLDTPITLNAGETCVLVYSLKTSI